MKVMIPGLGQSFAGGHGNPLQYSCLEDPMDSGAWWARVLRVTESDMTEHTHTHTHTYFYICYPFISFFIYKLIHFNWRLITLQYCSGFAIH